MTPNDIATDISASQNGSGSINLPSFCQTLGGRDWNQWDR